MQAPPATYFDPRMTTGPIAPLSAQKSPTTMFQQAAFTGAKAVRRTNVIA